MSLDGDNDILRARFLLLFQLFNISFSILFRSDTRSYRIGEMFMPEYQEDIATAGKSRRASSNREKLEREKLALAHTKRARERASEESWQDRKSKSDAVREETHSWMYYVVSRHALSPLSYHPREWEKRNEALELLCLLFNHILNHSLSTALDFFLLFLPTHPTDLLMFSVLTTVLLLHYIKPSHVVWTENEDETSKLVWTFLR